MQVIKDISKLQGSYIFSTPLIPDPLFEKSIIFLCEVQENTAYGFFIDFNLQNSDIISCVKEKITGTFFQDSEIYLGGPVVTDQVFILHSSEVKSYSSYNINASICVTKLEDAINDFLIQPESYRVLVGYCEWQLGQLEKEYRTGYWLSAEFSNEILFQKTKNKWNKCLKNFNIHPMGFSYQCGNA